MARTPVSQQDVFNHLRKFSDDQSQMDRELTKFLANRIVLDYSFKPGGYAEVTVDGYTQPLRVPVRLGKTPPETAAEPANALAPGDLETPEPPAAQEPPAAPRKRGRPPKAKLEDPICLTIRGVRVNYREHVRGLVSHIVTKFDMFEGGKLTEDWIREITGENA